MAIFPMWFWYQIVPSAPLIRSVGQSLKARTAPQVIKMLFSSVCVKTAGAWVNRKKENALPHPDRFSWLTPACFHHMDTKPPLSCVVAGVEVLIYVHVWVPSMCLSPKLLSKEELSARWDRKMVLSSWLHMLRNVRQGLLCLKCPVLRSYQ